MNSHQLEDNLQVIRTLMERSAMYQRAVRPILLLAGGVGTVAAIAGYFLQPPFVLYWAAIAVGVLAGAFYLSRRQALKDGEKFWSLPAKRVAAAMAPMMVVGLVLTVILRGTIDAEIWTALWLVLYGFTIHTAGMFALMRLRVLGWLCVIGGLILLLILLFAAATSGLEMPSGSAYGIMGIFFGVLHLVVGIIPEHSAAKE